MKTSLIKISMLSLLLSSLGNEGLFPAAGGKGDRITNLKVTNATEVLRQDEVISLKVEDLKKNNSEFNENAFVVFDGNSQLPSQTEDTDGDGKAESIVLIIDLKPKESKNLVIESDKTAVLKSEYKKRTHAEISVKTDYKLEGGYYTGGRFVSVKEAEVPKDHFAHDALYKFEGPAWESDRVAYRFYLDSRNRNDIFGKVTDRMVLSEVGSRDLISDSKESYTKMCDWGMDIFKVGESLGIGSIGIISGGKVQTISKVDNVKAKVTADGPLRSDILTHYSNWQVDSLRYDVNSLVSISAGSRLTKTEVTLSGSPDNIVTGIAKHDGCSLFKDCNDLTWGYIASYGQQSLNGDNLGLVIFFRKSDLIKTSEDEVSYIVELKPTGNKVSYYFGAAWDKELNGIKTLDEFKKYLEDESFRLSNPVIIEL